MRRPNRFVWSAQQQTGRARRAFRESTGPGHKLMNALGSTAYFFTLTVADLDPTLSDDPSGLYDATVMTKLFAAVARRFRGPVYAVAEVGKGSAGRRGRLHVQLIASRDDGPQSIKRDTERCKWVYDVFGLYRYFAKPPEPRSRDAEINAAAARVMSRSGRLPNSRRHFLGTSRLEWSSRLMSLRPNTSTDHPETVNLDPVTTSPEAPRGDLTGPVDETTESTRETPQTTSQPTPDPSVQGLTLPLPQTPCKKRATVRHEPCTKRVSRSYRRLDQSLMVVTWSRRPTSLRSRPTTGPPGLFISDLPNPSTERRNP